MKHFLLSILALLVMLMSWLAVAPTVAHADAITLAQIVQAGQQATFQLEIANETNAAHDYTLAVAGLPATLSATFTQGGPPVDKVTVEANQYDQVTLRIDVPADTPIDHYRADFTALREDGVSLSTPLALAVENTYALQIVRQNANITTFSGQEFTLNATAANAGAAAVTNLALVLEAPAKWVVQSDPPVVNTLAPGGEAAFTAKVLVPASQAAMDQPVKLTLSSDQVASPATTLTVRVQKSPTFLYGALALAGLAIVGVFIYFRAKGRR